MRAEALVQAASSDALAELLKVWGSDLGREGIPQAMRAANAWERVKARVRAAAAREDIVQVCANPFDLLAIDDIHDAKPLLRIGLISERSEGNYSVNLDLALALIPRFSAEYGFAATLLARLSDADFQVVARAWEVSPATNRTERLLAVAAAWSNPAMLRKRVASLVENERKVLQETLDLGGLDDDPAWELDQKAPQVTLDGVVSSLRGLLVRYHHEDLGVPPRLLVPLEVEGPLREALANVSVPELVTKKTRAKAGSSPATSIKPSAKVKKLEPAVAPSSIPEPIARKAQVVSASAIVDLGEGGNAKRLRENWELWSDVATMFDRRRVILKSGVNAAKWAQRAAIALADTTQKP